MDVAVPEEPQKKIFRARKTMKISDRQQLESLHNTLPSNVPPSSTPSTSPPPALVNGKHPDKGQTETEKDVEKMESNADKSQKEGCPSSPVSRSPTPPALSLSLSPSPPAQSPEHAASPNAPSSPSRPVDPAVKEGEKGEEGPVSACHSKEKKEKKDGEEEEEEETKKAGKISASSEKEKEDDLPEPQESLPQASAASPTPPATNEGRGEEKGKVPDTDRPTKLEETVAMDMGPVNLEDDAPSLDKMAAASSLFQCPVPPANTFSSSPSLSPSHTPESDQEVKEGFLVLSEEEESQGEKEEERGNEGKDEQDGEKMEVDAEKEGEKEENAGITTKDAVVPSTSPAPSSGDAEEEGRGAAPSTRKRAMTGDSDPAGHAQGGEEEGPGGPEGQSKRPRVEGGELEAHLELKISASPETRLKLEKVVQQLVAEQLRVWQLSVIDRSLQELRERVERIDCATKHQQTLNTLQAKIARLTKKFGAANQAKENARKPQEMLSSPSAAASTPNATTNTTPAYREDESAKAAVLLRTFDQSVPQIMVNKETRCPLCRVCYKNVNVHLEKTHKVTSSEERKLILAKASLRFKGRMDCPVEGCGKTGMARLKLHLINKHHLRDTEDYMKKAKLAAINERLKAFDPQWSPDEGEVSKVEDLQSRVAQLERRLQSLTGEQPLPGPATDEAPSPPSAFEQVLEDYTQYCCGLSREPEALDNASQQAARVREWLHFISSSHGTPSAKMRFLANVHLTGKWLEELSQSNYSRLTMRAYIDAAVNFLTYLEEMSPPKVKLPAAARRTLCGIFRVAKEGLTPDITLSRQEQKAKKSDRILSREDMRTFLFAAKEKIPRLLAKLRRHPKNRDVFADTVGFLLGYMYMLTGHRKEVLINMTTKDFNQCKSDPRGVYLVSITWHKTSAKFGRASLLLRKDELEWFIKFSAVRSSLPGYGEKPKTFFFNSSGHPLNRVGDYIVKVWSSLRLPGTPTVTLIRSSLATLVSDLPENKRQCASTPTHDAAEDSDDPGLGTSSQVYLPSARRKRRLVILDSDESSKEEEGEKCAKESRKDDAGFADIQDAPCSPLHELAEDSDPGEGTSSMVGLSLLPKRPPEGVKRRIMAYPEDFQKLTRQVFSTYLVEDICQS